MKFPSEYIRVKGGTFQYKDLPIHVSMYGRRQNQSFIVACDKDIFHYTAIPTTGMDGMMEAMALVKQYEKEYNRFQRRGGRKHEKGGKEGMKYRGVQAGYVAPSPDPCN